MNKNLEDLIAKYNHNLNKLKTLNYVSEKRLDKQQIDSLLSKKAIIVDNIKRLKKQIKEIDPNFD